MADKDPHMDLPAMRRAIANALEEDIGAGDITSELTIPADTRATMQFVAREPMVVCGAHIPSEVYRQLSEDISVEQKTDGAHAEAGFIIATATGNARLLLAGERVALNLMQRMSGVATLTRRYADAVKGSKAIILDTRKTMPGLRAFDKYAVRVGGGENHRFRLDDMVLIKDNHIALAGGIAQAVEKARAHSRLPIEVECDTLEQLREALQAKPDRILLDNMRAAELREAVSLAAGRIPLEASGGVSLETISAIAATGVDYISVGKLTHSARAMDIGADITFDPDAKDRS